jgi:hypothetical protein
VSDVELVMPEPPVGYAWRAAPAAADGWIVLYLDGPEGPAPKGPSVPEHERQIMGLCGSEPQHVMSMAGLLLERYRQWRPGSAAAADIVAQINAGR